MLSKIQNLLDSNSISAEVKEVLIKAKEQALFLKAIPDFREDKTFQRFVKEHDTFWKDNIDYPLSKYNEFPSVEDISEIDNDYEFYIHCKFTWGGHFSGGDEEVVSVKFKSSWLNAKENESPWITSWEDELKRECKRYLRNSESLKDKDLNSVINELLGSLTEIEINSLKNLHLGLKLLNKMKIKDSYLFLMNGKFIDKDMKINIREYLLRDEHFNEQELKDKIKECITFEEEEKQLEEDYKKFKELEKRFKNESVR